MLGVPVIVGALFVSLTVIVKVFNTAFFTPSLTEIKMSEVIPTSALLGVPLSFPVAVSNVAQVGLLVMLKVSVSLSSSLAIGIKV